MESSLRNMVLSLTGICLVCSAALGGVYVATKGPVEAAEAAAKQAAITSVLPSVAGQSIEMASEGVYKAVSSSGEVLSYAIEVSDFGYGGAVNLMVGITADGIVNSVAVLSHSETPGLGAKCTEGFKDQFAGLDPSKAVLKVSKDGGSIDAISAATITSRACCAAVAKAVDIFRGLRPQMLNSNEIGE